VSKLGWDNAKKKAEEILADESMTREQQLEIFKRFYSTRKEQDMKIAVALISGHIKKHADDFDRDMSLENLVEYGNQLCKYHSKEFGREVLYQVLCERSVPAHWIDRIADEETSGLREAFVVALQELAGRKKRDLDRIFGMTAYFMDDPVPSVRDELVKLFAKIAERDSERLHYFLVDFSDNAGTARMGIIGAVKAHLGWK